MLSHELTQTLLHIVRGNNIAEALIDYIAEKEIERLALEDIAGYCTCESLKKEIKDLKEEISDNEDKIEKLDELERVKEIKSDSLNNLIEEYRKDHNRYPSIDEAWEAAWNGCQEYMKKSID